jgi:signal transduction histidine kinase
MAGQVVPHTGSGSGRLALVRLATGSRGRYLLGITALGALYYGAAHVGYAFDFAGPVAAIVWLPVGVGVAFLYLGGVRFWPGVLLGDLPANDYSALPLGSALGQTCGNLLEVLIAAFLMQRLIRRGSPLDSVGGLGRMLVALAAGALVSATVGPLSLRLGHVVAADGVPEVWRTWWLGDFSGALVVFPLAVAWYRPARWDWSRARALEAGVGLAVVIGLSALAFRSHSPLTYLVFPALIWAALRFGQRGATLGVVLTVGFAVWNTTHYTGPFAFESITRSVLSTQLFIAVAALSTLCLAAVVSERERFARRLGRSRARLVEAGDTERRRLEHDLHDGAQQRLTALAFHLDRAADEARQDPHRTAALFEEAGVEVSLAVNELRELAHGIHPAVLTDLGLAKAIEVVAARSAVPIRLLELPSTRLDGSAEATAYFVFAEAVTNAQKHAQASTIWVRAAVAGGVLRVKVVDDGIGGATQRPGSGLQGLGDRVEAIGGSLEIESPAGHGTQVAAAIPVATTRP